MDPMGTGTAPCLGLLWVSQKVSKVLQQNDGKYRLAEVDRSKSGAALLKPSGVS